MMNRLFLVCFCFFMLSACTIRIESKQRTTTLHRGTNVLDTEVDYEKILTIPYKIVNETFVENRDDSFNNGFFVYAQINQENTIKTEEFFPNAFVIKNDNIYIADTVGERIILLNKEGLQNSWVFENIFIMDFYVTDCELFIFSIDNNNSTINLHHYCDNLITKIDIQDDSLKYGMIKVWGQKAILTNKRYLEFLNKSYDFKEDAWGIERIGSDLFDYIENKTYSDLFISNMYYQILGVYQNNIYIEENDYSSATSHRKIIKICKREGKVSRIKIWNPERQGNRDLYISPNGDIYQMVMEKEGLSIYYISVKNDE